MGLVRAAADARAIGLKPHAAQRELLELIERHRIVVAACGRRFGKTRAGAAAALWNLLLTPEADQFVTPGEPRFALSVANSREQAKIFLSHARTLVNASATLQPELLEDTEFELRFRGNRVLRAMPCSAKSVRGYAASFVLFDEFGHFFDIEEGGPAVAKAIWRAITPHVIQFKQFGRVVVISTPGGENLFSELYTKARSGEIPGAAAFHAPSWANPMIDASYLQAEEVALGADDYAREFGAEFRSGSSSFIEESAIRACVGDWRECLPGDGAGWVASFDPSFSRDPAALAIVGRAGADRERLLVAHVERWLAPKQRRGLRRTREDTDVVIGRVLDGVAAVCAGFNVTTVLSDQHLPGTVTDELAKRGLSCQIVPWTASSKTEAFKALRARIHTKRIELPDDPQLIAELTRLRSKVRAGASSVETPKVGDSHCDLAVALAAAVARLDRSWGVSSDWQQAELYPEEQGASGYLNKVF